jgi:hypothetical protein
VSGWVLDTNKEAQRLNEHLGFEKEAVLKGAGPGGVDVIIYVMWREGCRHV